MISPSSPQRRRSVRLPRSLPRSRVIPEPISSAYAGFFGGAGFFAKWYVLQAALQAPFPQTRLAVILVVMSVVSAGYYLYVVMVMFMKPRASTAVAPERTSAWTGAVVWGSAAVILILGLFPDAVVSFTQRSTPAVTREVAQRAP